MATLIERALIMKKSQMIAVIEERCADAWCILYGYESYFADNSPEMKRQRAVACELLDLLETIVGHEMYYDERKNCMVAINE